MNQIIDKAKTLSEALPYIQKYHGKTIVIKYGGAAISNGSGISDGGRLSAGSGPSAGGRPSAGGGPSADELCQSVISDVVLLSLVGISVVLVHGGGPEINEMLKKIGKEPKFIDGLRYTDGETMDIVQMVLSGRVGKQLAQLIGEHGGKALSMSGIDGRMLVASKLSGKDLGFVGELTTVNPEPVKMALEQGYIPVISTIACGEEPGVVYNVNADTAAARLASALEAEKLILMTDVRGLMYDLKDESTLITEATLPEVAQFIKEGVIAGGMIPKVECCVEAIRQGVPRAHILDGRIPHSILIEILSDHGIGTMIVR